MRLLIVLFSLYLLGLSAIPCTDAITSGHTHTKEESEHKETTKHSESDSHENEHEDTCPPLCACSCCGVTLAFLFQERFSTYQPQNQILFNSLYIQASINHFNHSIWQPPKTISLF